MSKINKALKKIYSAVPFKKQLYFLIKTIYTPPHSIYKHLYFKGWFNVKIDEAKFSIYHHGYEVENEIFWKGFHGWEGLSLQLWIKLSALSEVTMDIGANTGIYALISKSVNPNSNVYAYEPVKRVYEKLTKNINENHFDIKSEEIAISNKDGVATIYDQPTDHIYSVTVNENLASSDTPVIPVSIITKKLSTIIRDNKIEKLDLAKIDVETHEYEVLDGMEEYFNLFKPILLIEVLNNDVAEKINDKLKNLEYEYYHIFEKSGLSKVSQIEVTGNGDYNYLLLPVSRKKDILKIISPFILQYS